MRSQQAEPHVLRSRERRSVRVTHTIKGDVAAVAGSLPPLDNEITWLCRRGLRSDSPEYAGTSAPSEAPASTDESQHKSDVPVRVDRIVGCH